MSDKITPAHLERSAYVYVRQSSLQQVRHNLLKLRLDDNAQRFAQASPTRAGYRNGGI